MKNQKPIGAYVIIFIFFYFANCILAQYTCDIKIAVQHINMFI